MSLALRLQTPVLSQLCFHLNLNFCDEGSSDSDFEWVFLPAFMPYILSFFATDGPTTQVNHFSYTCHP